MKKNGTLYFLKKFILIGTSLCILIIPCSSYSLSERVLLHTMSIDLKENVITGYYYLNLVTIRFKNLKSPYQFSSDIPSLLLNQLKSKFKDLVKSLVDNYFLMYRKDMKSYRKESIIFTTDGYDFSGWVILNGYACSRNGYYLKEEIKAKDNKKGFWKDYPDIMSNECSLSNKILEISNNYNF